jgi:hypothetical protein
MQTEQSETEGMKKRKPDEIIKEARLKRANRSKVYSGKMQSEKDARSLL